MTTDERNAWLAGLKEGSEVVEERGYGYKVEELATISRVTDSQFIITTGGGERRYRRKNGQKVGGDWHQCIRPADDAARGRIRKVVLVARMERIIWNAMPIETLEAMAALLPPRKETS